MIERGYSTISSNHSKYHLGLSPQEFKKMEELVATNPDTKKHYKNWSANVDKVVSGQGKSDGKSVAIAEEISGVKRKKSKEELQADAFVQDTLDKYGEDNTAGLLKNPEIEDSVKQQIRKANNEIILIASYFIPSLALKRLLKNAAKRGVNVKIVLSSFSDVSMVKYATEYFYNDLLKAGINIYEWKQSVLHAKVGLIDAEWLSVGSYNLNHLSDFGSIECNLEILDKEFCLATNIKLNQLINDGCEKITMGDFDIKKSIKNSFLQLISYILVRFSLSILFFLQGKKTTKN
jgi:cardiolipin synthase